MKCFSVIIFFSIFLYDCTSFRNRNDHLCSVLENTHKSYYNNQYHFCRQRNRRRNPRGDLKTHYGGKNGAASNDGILIKWEKVSGYMIIYFSLDFNCKHSLRLGPEEAECGGRVLLHGQGQRRGEGGAGAVGQAGALQGHRGHP